MPFVLSLRRTEAGLQRAADAEIERQLDPCAGRASAAVLSAEPSGDHDHVEVGRTAELRRRVGSAASSLNADHRRGCGVPAGSDARARRRAHSPHAPLTAQDAAWFVAPAQGTLSLPERPASADDHVARHHPHSPAHRVRGRRVRVRRRVRDHAPLAGRFRRARALPARLARFAGQRVQQTGRAGDPAPTLAYVRRRPRTISWRASCALSRCRRTTRAWSHLGDPAPEGPPTPVDSRRAAGPTSPLPAERAIGIRIGRLSGPRRSCSSCWLRLAELAAFARIVARRSTGCRRARCSVVADAGRRVPGVDRVGRRDHERSPLLVIADAASWRNRSIRSRGLVSRRCATIAFAVQAAVHPCAPGCCCCAWRHRRQIGATIVGTFAVGGVLRWRGRTGPTITTSVSDFCRRRSAVTPTTPTTTCSRRPRSAT